MYANRGKSTYEIMRNESGWVHYQRYRMRRMLGFTHIGFGRGGKENIQLLLQNTHRTGRLKSCSFISCVCFTQAFKFPYGCSDKLETPSHSGSPQ